MLYAVVPYRSKDLKCNIYDSNVLVYDTETLEAKYWDLRAVMSSTRQIHGFSVMRQQYLDWRTFNYTGLSDICIREDKLCIENEEVCPMAGVGWLGCKSCQVVYAVHHKDFYIVRLIDNEKNWYSVAYYKGEVLAYWDSTYENVYEESIEYESDGKVMTISGDELARTIDSALNGV